ncbi:MAG: hypothetical protein AVDCRST_MAG18-4155, partial [uncultured Thermomicrobiales bacterium]
RAEQPTRRQAEDEQLPRQDRRTPTLAPAEQTLRRGRRPAYL